MSRKIIVCSVMFLGAAMLSMVGLNLAASSPDGRPAVPSSACLTSEKAAGLLDAGPTDQELIAKQKTCPVTDKLLGGMGTPVKVTVKGRTVFLCCAGCKAKFLKDPDKYLAKLDKQNKKPGT